MKAVLRKVSETQKQDINNFHLAEKSPAFSLFSGNNNISTRSTCPCGGVCPRCEEAMQPKLNIDQSFYEQEADGVAGQMNTSEHEQKALVQHKTEKTYGRASDSSYNLIRDLGPGQPLDPDTRAYFEPRFGYDLSRVKVHSGSAAEQSAREVNAKAYAVGQDIVFGPGRFAPETHDGRRLIAHELTHIMQQGREGGIADTEIAMEQEANRVSTQAMSGKPVEVKAKCSGLVQCQKNETEETKKETIQNKEYQQRVGLFVYEMSRKLAPKVTKIWARTAPAYPAWNEIYGTIHWTEKIQRNMRYGEIFEANIEKSAEILLCGIDVSTGEVLSPQKVMSNKGLVISEGGPIDYILGIRALMSLARITLRLLISKRAISRLSTSTIETAGKTAESLTLPRKSTSVLSAARKSSPPPQRLPTTATVVDMEKVYARKIAEIEINGARLSEAQVAAAAKTFKKVEQEVGEAAGGQLECNGYYLPARMTDSVFDQNIGALAGNPLKLSGGAYPDLSRKLIVIGQEAARGMTLRGLSHTMRTVIRHEIGEVLEMSSKARWSSFGHIGNSHWRSSARGALLPGTTRAEQILLLKDARLLGMPEQIGRELARQLRIERYIYSL